MRSYTAERQEWLGKGAAGSTYADRTTFPCYAEPVRSRSRGNDAETTRAAAKLWTFLETELKVGDWIEVGMWSGHVLSINDFSSNGVLPTPDHREVFFG